MVTEELDQFLLEKNQKKVLLFPPFPNRLRFLTHRVTESYDQLSSFSVGEGLTRRTVVCHVEIRIQDHGGERASFNRDTPRFNNYRKRRGRGGRDGASGFSRGFESVSFKSSKGPGRSHFSRRPDKDLYVPAAMRKKYGSSENDMQVVNEPEEISVKAGKKVCDMNKSLLSECNKGDMQDQATDDLEKYSTVAPMDVIPSTLEHKTIVPVVTKIVDQKVEMESNCQMQGMTKVAVKHDGKVADNTAIVVEAMATPVNSQVMEMHSCPLADVTVTAEPDGGNLGLDIPIEVLESSKPATEEESNQLHFSCQVGKAMKLEDSRGLSLAETAVVLSLVDKAVKLEVSSDLDLHKTSLQVQKAVDLTSTLTEETVSDQAHNLILELGEFISEDDANIVLEKPWEVTQLKSEGFDCKEANAEGSVESPGANVTLKMQELIGDHCGKAVHDEASSVNGIILMGKKKIESKLMDVQEGIYEMAEKEPDDETMDIHRATSGAEDFVCMSDPNVKHLDPAISGIMHDEDLSEDLSLTGELQDSGEPCAANNVESLKFCPQAVQGLVVSDSEMASLCHKNVELCLADSGKALPATALYKDESPKSSTECQNKAFVCDNVMNLSALVNPTQSTFGVGECNYDSSCASMKVFAEHEEQESCIEEENIQQLLQEITVHLSEKDISIGDLKYDYSRYSQPGNVKFSQIIEIHGFMPQINREDLMEAFAEFPESEFKLQWVDSTHALGVFCSEEAASQALVKTHPFLKFRPLSEGTKQSKLKAYNCLDLPEPYKERPRTDTTVAKRFLNRALGLPQKRKAAPENIADSESVPAETVQSLEPAA